MCLCSCPGESNCSNHQSRYICFCCKVPLRFSVNASFRRNCWTIWHNSDTLVPRKLQRHFTDAHSSSSPDTLLDRVASGDRNDGSSEQAVTQPFTNSPNQSNRNDEDGSNANTIEDVLDALPLPVPARTVISTRPPPTSSDASSPRPRTRQRRTN